MISVLVDVMLGARNSRGRSTKTVGNHHRRRRRFPAIVDCARPRRRGGAQRLGDLERHRHPIPWQAKDNDVLSAQEIKTLGQSGSRRGEIATAAVLMPFAGISFLWFMGVVRDGFGRYEDRFFATVFLGSGVLFLAMMFVATAVAEGLVASNTGVTDPRGHLEVVNFGSMVLLAASKTFGIRMAAVFTMSLATIWLKTGLMPRWLVGLSYLVALALLILSDLNMWVTTAFPVWVLVVSGLILARSGLIEELRAHHD